MMIDISVDALLWNTEVSYYAPIYEKIVIVMIRWFCMSIVL